MSALERYSAAMEGELEGDPVERLRFFLSFALIGQDWIDVEQFIDGVSQQLAEREKQIVMLRDLIAILHKGGVMGFDKDGMRLCAEALAATQDLSGLVLCDAEPVAFSFRPYICAEYDHEEGFWADSNFYRDHVPTNAKDIEPLYKARKQT